MKLFVISKTSGAKVYLNVSARTRNDLRRVFNGEWFNISDGNSYEVNEVFAERETNNTAVGSLIGGLIGLIIGPEGLIIGAGLGAMLGNSSDKNEQIKVNTFNNS